MTEAIDRELTAVTMGIDRFERRAKAGNSLLDGEGLVPIWMGEALVPPRVYADWDAIFADLDGTLSKHPEVGEYNQKI